MRKFAIVILLMTTFSSFSQEEQPKDIKGLWLANTFFGLCTIEAKDAYKVNGNIYGGSLGREFYVTPNISLVMSLEHQSATGNVLLDANQVFVTHKNLRLPVASRFYTNRSAETSLFIDFGFYGGYLYNSKMETPGENSNSETNVGTDFGLLLNTGVSHNISENLAVRVTLAGQNSAAAKGNEDFPETKILNAYSFNLGIAFKI